MNKPFDDYYKERDEQKPKSLTLKLGSTFHHFVVGWFLTREFRKLLFAIPALAMAAVFVLFQLLIWLRDDDAMLRSYLVAAKKASVDDDRETVRLIHRRLRQLRGGTEDAAVQIAMNAARRGDMDTAYKQMADLVEGQSPGPLVAHLWIAESILAERVAIEVGDPLTLAKSHIDYALLADPENEHGTRLLADYYTRVGNSTKAIEILEGIGASRPRDPEPVDAIDEDDMLLFMDDTFAAIEDGENSSSKNDQQPVGNPTTDLGRRMQLAFVLQKAGRMDEAKPLLEGIAKDCDGREFDLDPNSLAMAAEANRQLGKNEKAISILERGLERFPDVEFLVSSHRKLQLARLKSLPALDPERIAVAERLLEREPNSTEVLMFLATLCVHESLREDAERLLAPIVDSGEAPAEVLDRLGMSAMIRDDATAAKRYYPLALEKDATLFVACNNLAWTLAHSEPVDLKRSLELVDRAVAMKPDNASVRGTRGQILVKMKRWQEAIEELQRCLNGMPENRKAHRSLMIAYRATGRSDLAEVHQRALDRLGPEPSSAL